MSGVTLTADPDETKANGMPVSTFDMNDVRRINQRLSPAKPRQKPPELVLYNKTLEEFAVQHTPHSSRPKLPTAVLQIAAWPEDAKLGLETDYVHVPYPSDDKRLNDINDKRKIAIYPKSAEEALCQTTPEPTSRPTGQFFKSLGKYTGFSLMVSTLRRLLGRTPNSSK